MVNLELTKSRYVGVVCGKHPNYGGLRLLRSNRCVECNRITRLNWKRSRAALKVNADTTPGQMVAIEQLRQRTIANAVVINLGAKLKYAAARIVKDRAIQSQRQTEIEECRTGARSAYLLSGLYASAKAAEVRVEKDCAIVMRCEVEIARQRGVITRLAVPPEITTGVKHE